MPRGFLAALLASLLAGCGGSEAPSSERAPGAPAPPAATIRLATTTSTRDSGLLDALLPALERETGVRVTVLAVGSGQALRIGSDGDADLLLTHDPKGEDELVASGAGVDRRQFMFNDFLIVGPAADPAGIRGTADAGAALRRIAAAEAPFVSRGDDSGTHRKEKRLWEAAGIRPSGKWYREAGRGMGATLTMAAEMGAYTLTDRATLMAHRDAPRLPVTCEGDPVLRNLYSVTRVNPERHPHVKAEAARRAEDWLTGPAGRRAVEEFRVADRQVFFLVAGP
jgi:tungstate transport system substrate-binding protein